MNCFSIGPLQAPQPINPSNPTTLNPLCLKPLNKINRRTLFIVIWPFQDGFVKAVVQFGHSKTPEPLNLSTPEPLKFSEPLNS